MEETNGAEEAWRLIHSLFAPDTQNRQNALMQIMMPAKPWCDHTEGFESGLEILGTGRRRVGTRFWNCVGRCSQVHSDDEYGPDFS